MQPGECHNCGHSADVCACERPDIEPDPVAATGCGAHDWQTCTCEGTACVPPGGSAATPSPGPRFVGEAKLQALADEVFKNGEIDDLEARSILAYIAKLEKQVADFTEIAEEKRLRGINASSRLAEAARRG